MLGDTQLFSLPGRGSIIMATYFRFPLIGAIPWAEGTSSSIRSSNAEFLQWPGKGALAAGSPHVTPPRYDLGSGLTCVGPTSLTSQQDTVIHRGRCESLPKICPEGKNWWGHLKKMHIWFSWWLNSNQFSTLFLRSHRWMFSLGWSLLKISWKKIHFWLCRV